jgi:hypothetical protein
MLMEMVKYVTNPYLGAAMIVAGQRGETIEQMQEESAYNADQLAQSTPEAVAVRQSEIAQAQTANEFISNKDMERVIASGMTIEQFRSKPKAEKMSILEQLRQDESNAMTAGFDGVRKFDVAHTDFDMSKIKGY